MYSCDCCCQAEGGRSGSESQEEGRVKGGTGEAARGKSGCRRGWRRSGDVLRRTCPSEEEVSARVSEGGERAHQRFIFSHGTYCYSNSYFEFCIFRDPAPLLSGGSCFVSEIHVCMQQLRVRYMYPSLVLRTPIPAGASMGSPSSYRPILWYQLDLPGK